MAEVQYRVEVHLIYNQEIDVDTELTCSKKVDSWIKQYQKFLLGKYNNGNYEQLGNNGVQSDEVLTAVIVKH